MKGCRTRKGSWSTDNHDHWYVTNDQKSIPPSRIEMVKDHSCSSDTMKMMSLTSSSVIEMPGDVERGTSSYVNSLRYVHLRHGEPVGFCDRC